MWTVDGLGAIPFVVALCGRIDKKMEVGIHKVAFIMMITQYHFLLGMRGPLL